MAHFAGAGACGCCIMPPGCIRQFIMPPCAACPPDIIGQFIIIELGI
jgi:hypothetical protein